MWFIFGLLMVSLFGIWRIIIFIKSFKTPKIRYEVGKVIIAIIAVIIFSTCTIIHYINSPPKAEPMVYVRAYTRKDGTHVNSYYRRYPNSSHGKGSSDAFWFFMAIGVGGCAFALSRVLKQYEKTQEIEESNKNQQNSNTTILDTDDYPLWMKQASAAASSSRLEKIRMAYYNDILRLPLIKECKQVTEQYENGLACYLSISLCSDRIHLYQFELTVNGETPVTWIFSDNPENNYGYKPLSYAIKEIQRVYETHESVILTLPTFRFFYPYAQTLCIDPLVMKKSFIWDKGTIGYTTKLYKGQTEDTILISQGLIPDFLRHQNSIISFWKSFTPQIKLSQSATLYRRVWKICELMRENAKS